MRSGAGRMMAATGAAVAAAMLMTACVPSSGDGEPTETPTATGIEAVYPAELEDPGTDLLDRERWGSELAGGEASWQFPEGYEPEDIAPPKQAMLTADGAEFQITIDGDSGSAEAVEGFIEESIAAVEDAGGEAARTEVRMGGRDYVVLLQDMPQDAQSVRTFFLADDASQTTFVVSLFAPQQLLDAPQERVEEFHQTVASLEVAG